MEELFGLFYQTSCVCTDTRAILKDSLFVALKGSNFNGNEFAAQAVAEGAKFAIVDEQKYVNDSTIFYVKDSLQFLQQLATFHRRKFSIPVIGITGSNGKTTSKELISTVLAKKYEVLFTQGNLNNHIGVPLTLLRLKSHHEIAVIEMGANKIDDIKELCEIAEPNYGIITNIGRAHLEGFKSIEGVIQAKTALYRFIEKAGGVLVANADDALICSKLPSSTQVYFYGESETASLKGKLLKQDPFVSFTWNTNTFASEVVSTHLVGKYNFYNFLAAAIFGTIFQVDSKDICDAIASYTPTNNRSQIEKTSKNTLILDAYNANPTSVAAALESFALMEASSKAVILGDMLELGEETYAEHKKVIDFLKQQQWDCYLVGANYMRFKSENTLLFFEDAASLSNYLLQHELKDALILVKGSRGIQLEKAIGNL